MSFNFFPECHNHGQTPILVPAVAPIVAVICDQDQLLRRFLKW